MDTNDNANWRETGVTNWALDNGFTVTAESGRYTMQSADSPTIVLDRVELDEVEHYLSLIPTHAERKERLSEIALGVLVAREATRTVCAFAGVDHS